MKVLCIVKRFKREDMPDLRISIVIADKNRSKKGTTHKCMVYVILFSILKNLLINNI